GLTRKGGTSMSLRSRLAARFLRTPRSPLSISSSSTSGRKPLQALESSALQEWAFTRGTLQPIKDKRMKLTISVLGKDIETIAEDALHALVTAEGAVTKASPTALAALATIMNGVEKCLGDVVAGAANPLQALVNAPAEL